MNRPASDPGPVEPTVDEFRELFETASGPALVLRPDLTIASVTDAYLRATMSRREEVVGRKLFEVFPEDRDGNLAASLKAVLRTRASDRVAIQTHDVPKPPEGGGGFEKRYWSTVNTPVLDSRGDVRFIVLRVEDVTDLLSSSGEALGGTGQEETAERTQEESERQFRDLADAIPNLAWMAHADGSIYWYNQRWYEYTGTTPAQMQGWGWQSVHDPEMLPSVLERWKESIRSGRLFEMVFPLRGADGVFRSFMTRVVPIFDGEGKIVRWFGTNTDVEPLHVIQEALRESEARLRVSQERLLLAQRAAKIAPWELDLDTEEFSWSDEVLQMLGQVQIRRSYADFLSLMKFSSDRESAIRALRAARKRHDYHLQFRTLLANGEVRLITARGKAFYNQGKNIMLGFFIDVTPPAEENPVKPIRSRISRRRAS